MIIQTARFGEIEVPDRAVFHVPYGMPGFFHERSFALIPYQEGSPFAFWQSLQDANLSFLLVDPMAFFTDYQIPIFEEDVMEFGISQENSAQVWNIATIPDGRFEEMTVNLMAPLLLNWRDRVAVQIIIEKTPYSVQHRLFPADPNEKNRGEEQVAAAAGEREGK